MRTKSEKGEKRNGEWVNAATEASLVPFCLRTSRLDFGNPEYLDVLFLRLDLLMQI